MPMSINTSHIMDNRILSAPSFEVDGIDVAKELIYLRTQNDIFKRLLIIKGICTEEEINDIINASEVEHKLTTLRR